MDDLENKRLKIYSHSPQAEQAILNGEANIGPGGVRRPDGTFLEQAKPLSFSIKELKEMVSNARELQATNARITTLSNELCLSQQGIQKLEEVVWMNNFAVNQMYLITVEGFTRMMLSIERVSEQLNEHILYVKKRDADEKIEKMQRLLGNLKSYYVKMFTPKFDITNSQLDNDLNDTDAFITTLFNTVMQGGSDSYFSFQILITLIGFFANVVRMYTTLFYYENGMFPGNNKKWLNTIKMITCEPNFWNKIQYYINLETDIPYSDKIQIGRNCIHKLAMLPEYIAFDADYLLYHSKDDYLRRHIRFRELSQEAKELPEDSDIYL